MIYTSPHQLKLLIMKFVPTKFNDLALLTFVLLFLISCSKDSEIFEEAIAENIEENIQDSPRLVSKTIFLSPSNDAYLQQGQRFNEQIIRVEPGLRTSYLMFDLDQINGEIEDVELQFTITADSGDGTVKIHKGNGNNWTEESISAETAPTPSEEVGTLTKAFDVGTTEKVEVANSLLTEDKISFVVSQESGNDIALAAKENTSESGPQLKVTYLASETDSSEESNVDEEAEESPEEEEDSGKVDDLSLGDELKAFPSAIGFGKYATGGRGGEVIHVTSLADSGPGTLREALETSGTRTVVFDVGGNINLSSKLVIESNRGNLTIAGETAPDPGITVRGGGLDVHAANIIIRYISVRVDDNNASEDDAIRLRNWEDNGYIMDDIILDHVSMSHGSDENFSTRGVRDVTVQNCMITNANTSFSFLFGNRNYNFTFIGNYISHTSRRNIFVGYGKADETSEWINNIVYGYEGGMNMVYGNHLDVIGNVYKSFIDNTPNFASIEWNPNDVNNPNASITDGSFYIADNFQVNPHQYDLYNERALDYQSPSRVIQNSTISSWANSVDEIEQRVFGNTFPGNSLHQDEMDAKAIADYFDNQGQFEYLNVPSKESTSRSQNYDTDRDGMADAWEMAFFGNLSKTAQGNDYHSGYTNLEVFLHSLKQ